MKKKARMKLVRVTVAVLGGGSDIRGITTGDSDTILSCLAVSCPETACSSLSC